MSSARPPDLRVLDRERDRDAREQRELLDRVRLEVHALDFELSRVSRLVDAMARERAHG
jgi:hypothetical protein